MFFALLFTSIFIKSRESRKKLVKREKIFQDKSFPETFELQSNQNTRMSAWDYMNMQLRYDDSISSKTKVQEDSKQKISEHTVIYN